MCKDCSCNSDKDGLLSSNNMSNMPSNSDSNVLKDLYNICETEVTYPEEKEILSSSKLTLSNFKKYYNFIFLSTLLLILVLIMFKLIMN